MTYEIFTVPLAELRTRTSMKWRRYPEDVLPLWVAEMDCRVAEPVAAALHAAIDRGDTGYPAGPVYEEATTRFAADAWGLELDPDRIGLMPDVMGGIRNALQVVTAPGDHVVVNPPVYMPFFPAVTGTGRRLLEVPMQADGSLDLAGLEEAFTGRRGPRPTAYLMSSPHNPTSRAHGAEELATVARLAAENNIRVVVDAIHAPLTAPDVPYVPYLAQAGAEDALVLFSASKAWNLAGLKAAVMVAGPAAVDSLAAVPYDAARGAASHLAVLSHAVALDEGRPWLAQLRTELAANRELLDRLLAAHLPQVTQLPGNATYLAWLDCTALGLDDPQRHFLDRARVALNPGPAFGAPGEGHVRLNLATSPEILTRAVEQMAASL
ncbi:cystathione beta-lyase [Raineyella antarctica]|uniref:cysteine-S-conjugate beta-lyase n=1 Tax=Raineyella antarctica TaxID=1577474 RepID=A0A1G6GPU2_9ACTN|nr:aminotransferase class I/II-fold pyridoxal phosphate-dependent enzyme [Raineyella antarctica]SDB83775.1 cystathione beta-lyase [Raineyella antarctica]